MIPIFLAVDTPDFQETCDLLDVLGDHVDVKFGLEFIYAHGLAVCRQIAQRGHPNRKTFIDAKPHDIPATVAGAIRSIITVAEPDFITLHTCDGEEPLIAAVRAADWCGSHGFKRPKLLGVTVLTSVTDPAQMASLDQRAQWAFTAKLDGLVCSAHEADDFAAIYQDMFLMVPGIRSGGDVHDQKRVATPRQAMDNGASGIVIGREIRNSNDPLRTVLSIKESMLTK